MTKPLLTCTICGRVGTKGFVQLFESDKRMCLSNEACARRMRALPATRERDNRRARIVNA